MNNRLTPLLILTLSLLATVVSAHESPAAACPAAVEIQFGLDRHEIGDDLPDLNQVAQCLGGDPHLVVEIQGHAYDSGDYDENYELSRKRNLAVMEYLKYRGVDDSRLHPQLHGKSETGTDADRKVVLNLVSEQALRLRREIAQFTGSGEDTTIRPRFLVATLPDPVEGFAAKDFDAFVEAIRTAMVNSGYLLVKKSLPWPTPEIRNREDTSGRPDVDAAVRGVYTTTPGALFFSPPSAKVAGVVVLIAGETRTSGVHKQALRTAILIAAKEDKERRPLTILGPSYSGTRDSLRAVLDEVTHDPDLSYLALNFQVVSGSASSPENWAVLEGYSYRTYAVDIDILSGVMFDHLDRLGIERHQIALLRESTPFGASSGAEREQPEAPGLSALPETDRTEPLELTYPVHISEIRSSYERLREQGEGTEEGESQEQLPLELEQGSETAVAVPYYGSATLTMHDMVLKRTLESIRRRGIKAVGIISSNIEDTLFLAAEIHRAAPETLLFTFEGQNLLAHPQYSEACRGMLVASSHTMFWQSADKSRLLHFASDSEHGLFLAVTDLLNHPGVLKPVEFKVPDGAADPNGDSLIWQPAWLSVVGRGGMYPLRAPGQPEDSVCQVLSCAETWRPGLGEFVLGIGFVVVLGAIYFWFRDPRHSGPRRTDFVTAGITGLILAVSLAPAVLRSLGASVAVPAILAAAGPVALIARRRASPWLGPAAVGMTTFAAMAAVCALGAFALTAPLETQRLYSALSGVSPLVPFLFFLSVPVLWLAAFAAEPDHRCGHPRRLLSAYVLGGLILFLGCGLIFNNGSYGALRGVESQIFTFSCTLLFALACGFAMHAGCRAYQLADARPIGWREPKCIWLASAVGSLSLVYVALNSYPFEPIRLYNPVLGVLLSGAVLVTSVVLKDPTSESRKGVFSVGRRPLVLVLNGLLGIMLASCFSAKFTSLVVSGFEFVAQLLA